MDILRTRKGRVAALATAGTLAFAGATAPVAAAQGPPVVIGGGLVNVQIVDLTVIGGDVLSDNEVGVGVAAGVAAQVCGLTAQVGVIAEQVARTGEFTCTNSAETREVTIEQ